jgi:hypothetical protein
MAGQFNWLFFGHGAAVLRGSNANGGRQNQLFFSAKKAWTSAGNPLNSFPAMKSETTTTVLIFVLGVFAALDVLFAVRTVAGQRELRSLQIQFSQSQTGLMQLQELQSLVKDTKDYASSKPSPELKSILDGIQAKPATR